MRKFILVAIFALADLSARAVDLPPAFESQDLDGTTVNYSSTVGTTPINLPTTANKVISEVLFRCSLQTPATRRCLISFDGTTYFTLIPGDIIGWSVKGSKKQIKINGNTTGVLWEAVVNYESY